MFIEEQRAKYVQNSHKEKSIMSAEVASVKIALIIILDELKQSDIN